MNVSAARALLSALLLVAVTVVATSSAIAAQIDGRRLYKQANASVVKVLTFDPSGTPIAHGTGFFVGDGTMVATNHHVVEGASQVVVQLSDGQLATAITVLGFDQEADLAVLDVSTKGRALPLNLIRPDVGEEVLTIGHPKEAERTLSIGIISGALPLGAVSFLTTTVPVSQGSSGGPVLNAEGAVVAVICASRRDAQNLNLAVPSRYLAAMIVRAEAARESEQQYMTSDTHNAGRPNKESAAPISSDQVVSSVKAINGACCGKAGLHIEITNLSACAVTDIDVGILVKSGPWKDSPIVTETVASTNAIVARMGSFTFFHALEQLEGHGGTDPVEHRWYVSSSVLRVRGCN